MFSPDGATILTASWDKTARLWDARTGKALGVLRGHTQGVKDAEFSPDGLRIVTAGAYEDASARIWQAGTRKLVAVLRGHRAGVNQASYSRDGKLIVTASDDSTVRIWDAYSAEEVGQPLFHTSAVRGAVFNPSATQVAAAVEVPGHLRNAVAVWDVLARTHHELGSGSTSFNTVAYSPNGASIVVASDDGTAAIVDASTGEQRSLLTGHTGFVKHASLSPDGTLVVTASADGTARVWDVASGATRPSCADTRTPSTMPNSVRMVDRS